MLWIARYRFELGSMEEQIDLDFGEFGSCKQSLLRHALLMII